MDFALESEFKEVKCFIVTNCKIILKEAVEIDFNYSSSPGECRPCVLGRFSTPWADCFSLPGSRWSEALKLIANIVGSS